MNGKVEIPSEVQQAWNTVAQFLNKQETLTFHINPFHKTNEGKRQRKYTLESTDKSISIVACEEWKSADKPKDD
ncbi:hypothetical protein DC345_04905 [Paenibacillus taichungensis]|uniref:Uncharacterized protein n=1 Tax=Paenibacillus taichungensis TaxID=484184 RepID=A0A329R291_9BACL|nr:hypothetical protein [Paenibacillus taichungensis]RAW18473.1 hypothetical protein DC345_04905 [Paenibacillus taichungensis]